MHAENNPNLWIDNTCSECEPNVSTNRIRNDSAELQLLYELSRIPRSSVSSPRHLKLQSTVGTKQVIVRPSLRCTFAAIKWRSIFVSISGLPFTKSFRLASFPDINLFILTLVSSSDACNQTRFCKITCYTPWAYYSVYTLCDGDFTQFDQLNDNNNRPGIHLQHTERRRVRIRVTCVSIHCGLEIYYLWWSLRWALCNWCQNCVIANLLELKTAQ